MDILMQPFLSFGISPPPPFRFLFLRVPCGVPVVGVVEPAVVEVVAEPAVEAVACSEVVVVGIGVGVDGVV